jgi:hypothetical protein
MIATFISSYPVFALIILVILIITVGCLELIFIGRLDIACVTWFWALLIIVVSVAFATELGLFRWFISIFVFAIGFISLLSILKKYKAR